MESLPPTSRRDPQAADISQDFPVPIADDQDDEDLRLTPSSPPPLPASAVEKLILNFPDEDDRVFKLDSGELELGDLDNPSK